MNHDEAVLQLTDFLQGGLSGQLQEEMSPHLATCRECQELAETCLVLAAPACRDGAPAHHPTAEEIALYAVRPAGLRGPARAAIALHLRDCLFCREDVETTGEAAREVARLERAPAAESARSDEAPTEESARRDAAPAAGETRHGRTWRPDRRGGRRLILLFAASILLVLAGYSIARLVVSRELRESRVASERMKSELQKARSWSGPVSLTVLTGAVRGAGRGETIQVGSGQPYVPIAVLPPLPGDAPAEERYRFEIVSAAGETSWALEMAGGAVRQEAATSGVVTFLVPADSLAPGRYELRVFDLAADAAHPLLKASFTVSVPG